MVLRARCTPHTPNSATPLRGQFDPNVGVHEAMKSIWESVVEDPDATVEEYFDIIIDDLLTSMGARQWRVRVRAGPLLCGGGGVRVCVEVCGWRIPGRCKHGYPVDIRRLLPVVLDRDTSSTLPRQESAAIALAALVPGRDMDQLQPYLERAWVMAFRALDDIKETVRCDT